MLSSIAISICTWRYFHNYQITVLILNAHVTEEVEQFCCRLCNGTLLLSRSRPQLFFDHFEEKIKTIRNGSFDAHTTRTCVNSFASILFCSSTFAIHSYIASSSPLDTLVNTYSRFINNENTIDSRIEWNGMHVDWKTAQDAERNAHVKMIRKPQRYCFSC